MILKLMSKLFSFAALAVLGYWFYQSQQSLAWPAVEGTVVERSNVSYRERERAYSFSVRYQYAVDGVQHQGRHSYTGGGSEPQGEAVREGIGGNIQVFYNPNDHGESTLQKGKPPFPFAPFLALLAATMVFKFLSVWSESKRGGG